MLVENNIWRATIRRRLGVTAAVLVAWSILIEGRLVQLQVVRHDTLKVEATKRQVRWETLPGRRGDIVDRRGSVLAHTVQLPTIIADPQQIEDAPKAVEQLCSALGDCTPAGRHDLLRELSGPKQFVYVARYASHEQGDRVAALGLAGVRITLESRRQYLNDELLAHTLGFVGTDLKAQEGLEKVRDNVIKGQDGRAMVWVDGARNVFDRRVETAPTAGATLELTIERNVQSMVEGHLLQGVRENRAASGSVIVMDVHTGELLTLASYPTFNPNQTPRSNSERDRTWRNRAVQDDYEPGSTMKIFTAAAALEHGILGPDDRIDVSEGSITVGRNDVISDTQRHGVLAFSDALAKSSNVATIKVAWQLGADRLTEFIRRFGFGRRTSVDFLGEAAGTVWDASALKRDSLARVAIGYQISVTALQMAAAVSSIANGGELLQPRIVRAVIKDGQRVETPRTVVRRTVSPEVARQMTGILEEVVESGTGTHARIPGYTVAAKTGTAEKWTRAGYSKDEHTASIVGFVPSREPRFAIVVVIDSPHGPNGHYGGPVAGPIFKRVAESLLQYTGVPPTLNPPTPLLVARRRDGVDQRLAIGPARPPVVRPAVDRVLRDGRVPDLTGVDGRDAAVILAKLGFQVQMYGDGVVIDQTPAPGTPIEATARTTVWLGRMPR
jgi:cell division protein FtsI (penicillin-binding protein 3)